MARFGTLVSLMRIIHTLFTALPHTPHQKSLRFLQRLIRDIIFYNFVIVGPEDKYGNGTKDVPAVMGTLIKSFALVLDSFVDSLVREAETLDFKTEIEQDIELELTALEMAQIDVSI